VAGRDQATRAVSDVHGMVTEHQACQRLAGKSGAVDVVGGRLGHAHSVAGGVRFANPISLALIGPSADERNGRSPRL
jgi:hypothetical protein